ncbi:hypothetical protein [Nocardioides donggukensis]|uniref:DUF3592 domain-containing protein n=1 Tax=Nocardioides donggukensis TaxID=2774019 RepID=A0A927Q0I9_9ACTN|nr:hypothetical protein [Nocardioides donggukensis]MBD8868484.1 hypothetical protein [Nocardioides donggukensis]
MAGYLIGLGILAFATWRLRSHRTPPGAVEFTGTVLEELSRRSTQTGRNSRTYAPRVAYRHPLTGVEAVLEPTRFGQHRFTAGESTALVYDPARDRVFRPLDRPVRETTVLVLLGVGFIVAQLLAR